MFFDDYSRFLETSTVYASRDRLNLRHEAIFAANADIFTGTRVLDIASHDGRWSLSALRAGASYVYGIEARADAVEKARANLDYYDEDPKSYDFHCADIFDALTDVTLDVDIVLCLGFFYHTYRHAELLHLISQINPQYLLLDTQVMRKAKQPVVRVRVDRPDNPAQATLDRFGHADRTLVGVPSVPAVQMMLPAYGFRISQQFDWNALLSDHTDVSGVDDYRAGRRATFRCESTQTS
jgi:hypothetical protein